MDMKKKQAPPAVLNDINVTPLVDVMLVMLIIFMVITPMLTKGQSVDKVKTANPVAMQDADKEDAVLISVTKNGDVYLGTKRTPADQLPQKVKDLLTNRLDKTVFIQADMRALYGKVADVVDNLRAAGVDNVGLIAELDQDAAARRRRELQVK